MNLMLLRNNFTIAVIPVERRSNYINSLEKASVEHDGSDFLKFIVVCLDDVLNLYFTIVR